jgi:hypothetical protein
MDDRVSLRHDFGDWAMLINDEVELMARFKHVSFQPLPPIDVKPASPFTFLTLTSNLNPSLVANIALNTLLMYLDNADFQRK